MVNAVGTFLGAVFVFFFVIVVFAIIVKAGRKRSAPESEFFACPYCSEPLRTGVIVCKHCHRSLER